MKRMWKNLVLMMVVGACLGLLAPVAAADDIVLGAITISGTKCPSLPTANFAEYLTTTVTNNTGEDKNDLWLSVMIKTKTSNGEWLHNSSASVGPLAPGETRDMCIPFGTPSTEVMLVVRDGSASHLSPIVASKTKTLGIAATREKLKQKIPALTPEIKKPVVTKNK